MIEMKNKRTVSYGEIYLYDFGKHEGSIQNGFRPALVIQDNRLNEHSPTTVIAAITSAVKKEYLPSHVFIGQQSGLTKPSMVLLEQIACVNQSDLSTYVGAIEGEKMKRIIRSGLKRTFGLWNYTPRKEADIRCLCSRCLQDYFTSNKYIVKRLDPFAKCKEQCDKCNSTGYDYVIIPRRDNKGQMCKS